MATFNLTVNGQARAVDVDADTPLLYVLRDNLELKGPRFGCGLAQCGACTVHVNGEAIRSCVLPIADVKGAVTTLEGLGSSAKPSKLQQAFIDEQAAQCGYCINGMIMTSAALAGKEQEPERGRHPQRAGRQSLPLWHPQTHRRRCEARGRGVREAAMTIHQTSFDRRTFLKASGILAVGFSLSGTAGANTLGAPKSVAKEAVDSWLTITPDNKVTIFVGKVDLGTGSRTALMQLAADELDVAFERIELVMGDTARTPDQWLTAANLTIFQGGGELRRACATARRALVERAAQRLGVPAADLTVQDARGAREGRARPFGQLRRIDRRRREARGRRQDRAEEVAPTTR